MNDLMRKRRFLVTIHFHFACTLFLALLPAHSEILYNGRDIEAFAKSSEKQTRDSLKSGDLMIVSPKEGPCIESRERLSSNGFEVLCFIPRTAYLVRISSEEQVRKRLLSKPSAFACVVPLQPEWKVEPCLRDAKDIDAETEVSLVLHATNPSEELGRSVADAGGRITGRSTTPGKERLGVRVRAKSLESFLDVMSVRKDIYTIEPGGGARLLNDNAARIVQSGSPFGGRPIGNRDLHGEGQVIAILDTGLDYDSCYFRDVDSATPVVVEGTAEGAPDLSRRKVIVYDFLLEGDSSGWPYSCDTQNHGTLVAGTALGSALNDPFGQSIKNGVAPEAQLIVQDGGHGVDDCSDLPALGCPVIDLTPFLDQAIAQGGHIHNNSWGDRENFFPQNTYTAPTADMDEAIWRNPEFLVVCAAGNGGRQGENTVGSPSVGKNVLSVGATGSPSINNGSEEERAVFSSLGWAADGRIKPDLMAPGMVVTALNDGDVRTNNCDTISAQGTSLSTPVVCGCAALIRQYYLEGWYPTGRKKPLDGFVPSAALIKATLLAGTVDIQGAPEIATPPPNREEGWGRVHLENSLYFHGDLRHLVATDQRNGFTTSDDDPNVLEIRAPGAAAEGPIKVVLVWTDYPANPAASIALVNDLDLVVTNRKTGEVLFGNNLDSSPGASGYSQVGGSADTLNNVEMVVLPPDTEAELEIRVEPSRIVEPPQGFALAICGAVIPLSVAGHEGYRLYR